MLVWNSHWIRPSMILYSKPEVVATRSYMKVVDQRDVDICRTECIFRGKCTCDQDMFELLLTYMVKEGFTLPTKAREGVDLYYTLRPLVLHDLFGKIDPDNTVLCLFKGHTLEFKGHSQKCDQKYFCW